MRTLETTTVARIRAIREQRGMSQQQLAERLDLAGKSALDRTAIAKVERGKRRLTLAEAFQIAFALDVAPLHLFVPTDDADDEPIAIGTELGVPPAIAREWIRGRQPLNDSPEGRGRYWLTAPAHEIPSDEQFRAATPGFAVFVEGER